MEMLSHPFYADSDHDGLNDKVEINDLKTDPLNYTEKRWGYLFDVFSDDNTQKNYAYFLTNTYKTNWADRFLINVSDWHKTEQAKQILIEYFYNYSTDTLSETELENRAKVAEREVFASELDSLLKIAKNIKTIAKSVDGLKEVADLKNSEEPEKIKLLDAEMDSGLKGLFDLNNNQSSGIDSETYEKLLEAKYKALEDVIKTAESGYKTCIGFGDKLSVMFGNGPEGVIGGVEEFSGIVATGFSTITTACKVLKFTDGFSKINFTYKTKSSDWLKEYGGVLNVVFSVAGFAVDAYSTYIEYSKITASLSSFNNYVDAIEYISTHGNGIDFIQNAAGSVLKIMKDNSPTTEFEKYLIRDSLDEVINLAWEFVGTLVQPIALAKVAIEAAIDLSGIQDLSKAKVEVLMADSISDAFVHLFGDTVISFSENGLAVNLEKDNRDNAFRYLSQLAQSRIYGEQIARSFFEVESLSVWIGDLARLLPNHMTRKQMIDQIDENIRIIRIHAIAEDLNVSPKLMNENSSNSGGGGGF